MRKSVRVLVVCCLLATGLLLTPSWVASQVGPGALVGCKEVAFSTEEDFVTYSPEPSDGNPIISDGDLLGPNGVVCARNYDLLNTTFDVPVDVGLDAADVLDVENYVVAFSTELDSPNQGQFTAGDLLVTTGVIIRNEALTSKWPVPYDIGLDAAHFVGDLTEILAFLDAASKVGPVNNGETLGRLFEQFPAVDIWFSTEGTFSPAVAAGFLDGDLLSARNGTIIATNAVLLDPNVPAGIPNRGVDFGLDAATTDRGGAIRQIHYSTEILYDGDVSFTDGDVLFYGDGVVATNADLVTPFEPKARMLGLDALSVNVSSVVECVSKITKIGGVDVADIGLTDGLVTPLAISSINGPLPFGGRIPFEGTICDDVDRFRVVYREAGSADPWEPMEVAVAKNWRVKVDAFLPPFPDCLGNMGWSSDGDGWFTGADYRHLTEAALGGCNPGLSLTIWESTAAVSGAEALYEVMLEADNGTTVVQDAVRRVQLDNTAPVVNLNKQPGTCRSFTVDDMPLMVTGRISDTYFLDYRLSISGNGYGTHTYPDVAYYDDLTDNVTAIGTVSWDAYVDLHEVDVRDLATTPVDCGYTVWLTAWDRAVGCGFSYPANFSTRCVGCRHSGDSWTFKYVP